MFGKTLLIAALLVLLPFAACACPADNTTQASGGQKAPAPVMREIEAYIAKHPDDAHRHIGWCGTPMMEAEGAFQQILKGHSAEEIIPLLEHTAPYLRAAVHCALAEMGGRATGAIEPAYESGSARIKLELLRYVNPDATDEERFRLLDEIIDDETLDVFYGDGFISAQYVREHNITSMANYPLDVFKLNMRLMKEAEYGPDRADAARQLGQFGSEAAGAVPAIVELLKAEDDYVPRFAGGFDGLISHSIRGAAAIALGDIGPAASDAIPALVDALNDPSEFVRICSASSLYLIGHDKDNMIKYLVDRLRQETPTQMNMDLLGAIADHLGRIGPDASAALPKLKELANYDHHLVSGPARNAIIRIEGSAESVIAILIQQLQTGDEERRKDAINTLSGLRGAHDISKAVPALVDILDETNGYEAYRLCETLVFVGGFNEKVTSAIIRQIEDREDYYISCMLLLPRIGPEAKAAMPALKKLIENDFGGGFSSAATVYAELGGDMDWLIPRIIDKLYAQNTGTNTRDIAIWVLRDLGPKASAALPALRDIAARGTDREKGFAEEAIAAIEGDDQTDAGSK